MAQQYGKIVVDLDGCLAGPKKDGQGYESCRPNGRMVTRLRELKAVGFKIAIYTSRNVRTHNSNPGLLIADTAPKIIDWLQKHDIPYDEVHVGKPWTGTVGYYVDDRALRPEELVNHSITELIEITKGGRYDPKGWQGRHESEQGWVVADLRGSIGPSLIVNGQFVDSVRATRAQGWRTLALVDPTFVAPFGLDEELRRLGARLSRVPAGDLLHVAGVAVADLLTEGVAGSQSPVVVAAGHWLPSGIDPVTVADGRLSHDKATYVRQLTSSALTNGASLLAKAHSPATAIPMLTPGTSLEHGATRVLKSRHFNHVEVVNGEVVKTGSTPAVQQKLALEYRWMAYHPDIVPPDLAEVESGYKMRLMPTGSLDKLLLRARVLDPQLEQIGDKLIQLTNYLAHYEHPRIYDEDEWRDKHDEFVYGKSVDRIEELDGELRRVGLVANQPWIVNGEDLGSPLAAVDDLLQLIPHPKDSDIGGWHGDLCPGNIVLDSAGQHPRLKLIDPRGSLNGRDFTLVGDLRYDQGKLAHALRWGYDTIVEGWRDCDWQRDGRAFDVRLELWDERLFGGIATNRRRLWDYLIQRISGLDDRTIHAFAALQLITCAPLHKDDPERMVALVARGLQAARFALGS